MTFDSLLFWDFGEAERRIRDESERHSEMFPNIVGDIWVSKSSGKGCWLREAGDIFPHCSHIGIRRGRSTTKAFGVPVLKARTCAPIQFANCSLPVASA